MAQDTTLSGEVRAWSQKILDDPNRDDYYAERALVLISNDKNYKLAIEDMETAIKINPKNRLILKLLSKLNTRKLCLQPSQLVFFLNGKKIQDFGISKPTTCGTSENLKNFTSRHPRQGGSGPAKRWRLIS